MQIDLRELLERAFDSGFLSSGEGYNGEYPFNYDPRAVSREIAEKRHEAIQKLLECVTVEEPSE